MYAWAWFCLDYVTRLEPLSTAICTVGGSGVGKNRQVSPNLLLQRWVGPRVTLLFGSYLKCDVGSLLISFRPVRLLQTSCHLCWLCLKMYHTFLRYTKKSYPEHAYNTGSLQPTVGKIRVAGAVVIVCSIIAPLLKQE